MAFFTIRNESMKKNLGITLIELMIAVAIVGILAAIAMPSYNQYVISSRRNEAKMSLLELAQYMERQYTSNGTYSGVTLPYTSVPKDGGSSYYNIALDASGASFTITLSPVNVMQDDDCGNYTINQTGAHSPSTSTCW